MFCLNTGYCRNGVSRAGVFCALSICVEQHKVEAEVDVFNAVKRVKRNRPQLVENIVCEVVIAL